MKTMKRMFAFALVAIMALAMTVTAFADEKKTYSITVENAVAGHTYEAYQIFAGDLSEDGSKISNIKWGSGISAEGQAALGDAVAYAKNLEGVVSNSSEATKTAETFNQYLAAPAGTVSVPADSANVSYKITGLDAGYYLIKDKDGSLDGTEDSYTEFILKVVKDQTVQPKADTTVVEKKVKDINDSEAESLTEWQDSADWDIGDQVPFLLKATLAKNVSAYDTYFVKFHDTLSAGLTYDNNYVVKIDGKDVTSAFTAKYEGTKLTFECADVKALGATNGSVITVEYTATLNNKAVIGSKGNPNKVYLEFSYNPNSNQGGDNTGVTPEDTVIVFTYKVVVNKVDQDNATLAGAEFTLFKKLADGTKKEVAVAKNAEGTVFTFKGLDDGDYVLSETKTPNGYNSISDIEFTVTAEHDIISDDPRLTDLNGNVVTGEIEFTKNLGEGSLSTNVVNQSGSVLPSTGGAGRVAIYVVGAVLVIGAGIVLVTKKRVRQ